MKLTDFVALKVADLWQDYQNKLSKGIDEPYIKRGDYVLVSNKENKNVFLQVAQSCKVATDLWFTTVLDTDGKDLILADEDIKLVLRRKEALDTENNVWYNKCVTNNMR